MFPGAHASIYRNEAGEVVGWDSPGEPEYDPDDYLAGDYDDDDDEDDEFEDDEDEDDEDDEPETGGGQHAYYSNDPFNDADGMV
jgi:hypothetical protein